MKRIAILGILFLAACGGGANGTSGSTTPNMGNAANAVVDAKVPNPQFGLATQLPDGRSAHSSVVTIQSMRAVSEIKSRKINTVFKTNCQAADQNNAVAGCVVIAENAYPNTITKTTFSLYSKPGGKGCLLATGAYKKYTTYQDEQIPVPFKLLNVKKCW